MKSLVLGLFFLISASVFAASEVVIPAGFSANKCEALETKLQNFANDLTKIAIDRGIPIDQAQESFDWILIEVGMAIDETPVNCNYAIDFTERKHKEFLKDAGEL